MIDLLELAEVQAEVQCPSPRLTWVHWIFLLQVKHAQCFDVALMDDGSVVLASKDYRLYIYRYVQVVMNMQTIVVYLVL